MGRRRQLQKTGRRVAAQVSKDKDVPHSPHPSPGIVREFLCPVSDLEHWSLRFKSCLGGGVWEAAA